MIASSPPASSRPPKLRPFGRKAHEFAFRLPIEDAWLNILCGEVRSSKTWSTFPKIVMLCKYEVEGDRVLFGKTKESIYHNILTDLFDIVGTRGYTYNRQSGELDLLGSKWRVIGANDERSEQMIRGSTVGVAVGDELTLIPKSFLMMLLGRMSPEGSRLYGTTNPDVPTHYLKEEIIDNKRFTHGLRGADLNYITFTMDDNPNLDPAFKDKIKRSYTGVFYKRFVLGLWVMGTGSIYADVLTDDAWYDDASRPINLYSRHGHVDHFLALDYGTANALACGDYYDDGLTIWCDDEFYYDSRIEGKQLTDGQYADRIVEWLARKGFHQRNWPGVIIDPSAASFRAELISRGFYVGDAVNDVSDGIRRTSTMLANKKLRINKQRCVNGVKFMQSYCWEEGKEKPKKEGDHWPDQCRYAIASKVPDWRLAA